MILKQPGSGTRSVLMAARATQKTKYWCFTLNTDGAWSHRDIADDISFAVYQLERGENGNRHYQGYIECPNRKSLAQVKRLIPGAHFEVRRGSQHEAIAYCQKGDSRIGGPWVYGEPTTSNQGQRTDLSRLVSLVKEGKSLLTIVETDSAYMRFATHIKTLQSELPLCHRPDIRFAWLYGESGGGKTRSAYDAFRNRRDSTGEPYSIYLYDDAKTEWWQGYNGEQVLLIDDFQGNMESSRLIRLLDRYEYRVPVKGSSRTCKADKIIITSHARFDSFQGLHHRRLELRRRFRDFGLHIKVDKGGSIDVTRGDPDVDQPVRLLVTDMPLILRQWLVHGEFSQEFTEACRMSDDESNEAN